MTDTCDVDTSLMGMKDDLNPLLELIQDGAEDCLGGIPVMILFPTDTPGLLPWSAPL
jgi:hypothetical protein